MKKLLVDFNDIDESGRVQARGLADVVEGSIVRLFDPDDESEVLGLLVGRLSHDLGVFKIMPRAISVPTELTGGIQISGVFKHNKSVFSLAAKAVSVR